MCSFITFECRIRDRSVSDAAIVHSLCESFMEQESSSHVQVLGIKVTGRWVGLKRAKSLNKFVKMEIELNLLQETYGIYCSGIRRKSLCKSYK